MAEFNHEQAIKHYTELQRFIQAGAYDERDVDGSYGEDGIEKAVDGLDWKAAQHGLAFHWHKESDMYTLEPLDDENKAAFLHVNVEALISILAETARHLLSIPYESEMERSYRTGLHERIKTALEQSYLVPVLLEEAQEPTLRRCPYCGQMHEAHLIDQCPLKPTAYLDDPTRVEPGWLGDE